MRYSYRTSGTCSSEIQFDLDGDTVTNIVFFGGCDGNLKAIPRLIDGWTVSQIEDKLLGVTCSGGSTSCSDQLARAVRAAYDQSSSQKNPHDK